jgi:hypothetical protein
MALKAHICLLLLVCMLSACKREQMDDCFTSTGSIRMEERSLEAFHGIDLDDRIDLVLDHLPATTITVEAGKNLLGQISTEVRDGVLHVRNENRCNWVRSFKPRITVRVPIDEVDLITVRGQGDVSATDTIRKDAFRIEQWGGMGTADLIVDVSVIHIGLHTGAGDVILKGRTGHSANFYSGMLGTIDASGMRARVVNVNNSGVGDFRCWAHEGLNVRINDAGDVYYRGDATVSSEITGSGRLIKVDQ